MTYFSAYQADYLLFLTGFSLLFLAASAHMLESWGGVQWKWLGISAFLMGLRHWTELIFFSIPDENYFRYVNFVFIFCSSLSIFEFGRHVFIDKCKCKGTLLWVYFLVLPAIAAGAKWGLEGLTLSAILFAGVPGGIISSLSLSWIRRNKFPRNYSLSLVAIFLFLFWFLELALLLCVWTGGTISLNPQFFSEIQLFTLRSVQTLFVFIISVFLWVFFSTSHRIVHLDTTMHGTGIYKFLFPAFILLTIAGGWVITDNVGSTADQKRRNELLNMAKAIMASLDLELLAKLEERSFDVESMEYKKLQKTLTEIGNSQTLIRYIYMMKEQDGKIFFLIDSEPDRYSDPNNPLSSPGDIYNDASDEFRQSLKYATPLIEGPLADEWGKWITAFVPVRNRLNGSLLACLGMDVDASDWNKIIEKERLAPITATMLICIVLTILFVMHYKERESLFKLFVSEQRNKTLVEGAPSCIELLDGEGRYLSINHYGSSLKGVDVAAIQGKFFMDCWPDEAGRQRATNALDTARNGKSSTFEAETKRDDGSTTIWEVIVNPILDEEKAISNFVVISNDITSRKMAEIKLIKAKEETDALNRKLQESVAQAKMLATEAEAANAAKSEFLANMSHEIRTPMNGIIGLIGIIRESKLDDQQREYATMIEKSAENLLVIINDILDFSKIESGTLELNVTEFNLRQIIEDTLDMTTVKAQEKKLELVSYIHPDVPLTLEGDPIRLKQVLTNILGNAVKFTEKGEVSLDISLKNRNGDEAEINFEVKDSGIGISPDKLNRLFKAFSQVDSSSSRKYGGTGLGLSISKRLVEKMKGSIAVESALGLGSKFYFTAILKIPNNTPATEDDSFPTTNVSSSKILCVDDNSTNRLLLSRLLDSWKLEHDEAADGFSALEKMRKAAEHGNPYKLVLLDMFMPGMDGEKLAKEIKSDPLLSSSSLVMMSSAGIAFEKRIKQSELFAASLPKPLKKIQLYKTIMELLNSASSKKETTANHDEPRKSGLARIGKFQPSLKVLVVEDNAVNQIVAKSILAKMGVAPVMAGNGSEALSLLESRDFDLVLLDIQMPEMSGYEVTEVIRDSSSTVRKHDITIIAMTAHALKGDREKCLDAGMNDYVSKPVNPAELWEVISKYASPICESQEDMGTRPSKAHEDGSIFDKDGFMNRIGGNPKLYAELSKVFFEDAEKQIATMRRHLQSADMDKLAYSAHTLKGASANFGAVAIQRTASLIEEQCPGRCLDMMEELISQIENQFAELKRLLLT